jgi:geranylgeranyl pyrophosphate synthase/predicted secreted hydrolase
MTAKSTDESAHEDRDIEWWFVQGYYDAAVSGRRFFMVALFRNRVDVPGHPSRRGFSYILSVLDPESLKNETLSRIDPAVIDLVGLLNKGAWRANVEAETIEAFTSEITAYGPFPPVELEKSAAKLSAEPLSIAWKGFSLDQTENSFSLSFEEPAGGRSCGFDMVPEQPRIFIEETASPRVDAMAYATYPRLRLTGRAGAEEATGEAWLDHQWGDFGGWFVTQPKDGRLLGWDWLGINLDDGTDIIVMIHRDMQTREPAGQFAIVRRKDEEPIHLREFVMEPVRFWESPATRISYPLSWQLEIPGAQISLEFSPLADDQEIRMFGLIRAIWEGAGTVRGTSGGTLAAGRARLELYGYGFLFDLKKQTDALTARVTETLESFFPRELGEEQIARYTGAPHWRHEPAAYRAVLSRPVWDLMSRHGKCWRPLFGTLLLESLGVRHEPYAELVSCISEMTHTGALIIDDIEDGSETRRGDECIHRRYGLDVALNAGNTLYFLPYLLLERHPLLTDGQRLSMHQTMIRQSTRCHFGQGLDLFWSGNMTKENLGLWLADSPGPKVLQMYAYKTATASEGMAEVACVIAGSDARVSAACASFGRIFGVAFQIVDDIHDFSSSPPGRRACGEDIRTGKLTYVLLRALERLDKRRHRRLRTIVCADRSRKDPEAVQEGLRLVRGSGALEECRSEAVQMFENEWDALSRVLPPSEPKVMLRMLCAGLLNLGHSA